VVRKRDSREYVVVRDQHAHQRRTHAELLSAFAAHVFGIGHVRHGISQPEVRRAGFLGKNDQVSSINADLTENFRQDSAGILQPASVTAYNTPLAIRQHVAADIGLYITDTWKYKRLALTGGLRWEYEKSVIDQSDIPAGRFSPGRSFAQIDCSTISGLGCWKTLLPRIGAAYDLTGNGKTALRFSFGLYNSPKFTGYLNALIRWLFRRILARGPIAT